MKEGFKPPTKQLREYFGRVSIWTQKAHEFHRTQRLKSASVPRPAHTQWRSELLGRSGPRLGQRPQGFLVLGSLLIFSEGTHPKTSINVVESLNNNIISPPPKQSMEAWPLKDAILLKRQNMKNGCAICHCHAIALSSFRYPNTYKSWFPIILKESPMPCS